MKNVHTVVFKSWGEYVEQAENGKSELSDEERRSLHHNPQFIGAKDAAAAYKLAREGWKAGAQEINNLATPIFNHVSKMIERVEVNHDVEGHSIDVARFVDGEPEAWMKFENVLIESESGHKLIRLVFNMSASGHVENDVIQCKGAAVAALVELLEYAGHRVEVIVCDAGAKHRGEPVCMETYVRLKEFDQNIDSSILAFALAHPANLRVLFFSILEQCPADVRREMGVPNDGYGSPADVREENRGDIYIGKSSSGERHWDNVANAEKWIISQLEKQGIKLNLSVK